MSDSIVTKLALAESLKNLMVTKTFGRIYVSDIAGYCGLTRQAFYYHFKDKFDLMNWIFAKETAYIVSSCQASGNWTEGYQELCNYVHRNKAFYMNALNTTGQNSFQDYLYEYINSIILRELGNIENPEAGAEKWGCAAEVISIIITGLLIRWINSGMKEKPSDYVNNLKSLFDGSILLAAENHGMKIFED